MAATVDTVERVESITADKYKYGFVTDIEMESAPIGLEKTLFALFLPRRKSHLGCSNGV